MDWVQILSLFLANASLIIWFRSESRADWRQMDAKVDAQLTAMRQESKEFQAVVIQEFRDFHGRLCSIEERNKR